MRKTWLLGCLITTLALPLAAQDRGLIPPTDALGGPAWQARFERDALSLLPARGVTGLLLPTPQGRTLRLFGDVQFSALRLGDTGGLRLTGGLLINLRPSLQGPASGEGGGSALPYAGIGYASGGLNGRWGFSADLGLAAPGLGSARLDRLLSSGTGLGLDTTTRLLPMVRLGMSLAF